MNPQYRLGMALGYAVWPWGKLSGKTGDGERKVGQNLFFFPHWYKKKTAHSLWRLQQTNQSKLPHLCLEVWEQQYLRGRDLCDATKHLLGYDLKLPSGWILLFPNDGIRRLSFQGSWQSAFWAPAGVIVNNALSGVRWKHVVTELSWLLGCVGGQKGEQALRERNRTWSWNQAFFLSLCKLLNFLDCFPK